MLKTTMVGGHTAIGFCAHVDQNCGFCYIDPEASWQERVVVTSSLRPGVEVRLSVEEFQNVIDTCTPTPAPALSALLTSQELNGLYSFGQEALNAALANPGLPAADIQQPLAKVS